MTQHPTTGPQTTAPAMSERDRRYQDEELAAVTVLLGLRRSQERRPERSERKLWGAQEVMLGAAAPGPATWWASGQPR